ncbi:hypothetical protein EZ456_09345 [Pedobacter psychrodurus]|uniref:Tetratricopeptide repeat protein n=1 Tax=Pedobacter psychrodurus TaxID=2530456 RepID=A0A4R0Q263_9SPHI|nr:hypothetical protein [Pedobacter psychrodurus]TCD27391.1 hypothetical protein EZ456_09345 [Pedobacter psychrodurus]
MKTFKKLSLVFSIFLLTFFGEIAVNLACGGEIDPYDYYISYFHNNIEGDEYTPFAYNQMVYLNSETDIESEPDINSREWAKYLSIKKDDVLKVMYKTDSATDVKLVNFDGNISLLPDSLQQNSFIQALSKRKESLKYYQFAKSCEPLANVDFSLWDPKPRDTTAMGSKAKEAVKLTEAEKDDFLKLRYAYQAERMFHFAGSHAESKSTYEKYIKSTKQNSAVKGWALALYAGSTRRLGNPEESAFLFSKVFASNPERRVQAYKNYYYTSSPVNGALKYAKTNNEKANIWAINGFGDADSGIESLNKVYQYEPKSQLNGALLVREVNKLEQDLIEANDIAKIGYNYYFSDNGNPKYKDSLKNINLKHLNEIRNFAVKLATEKKYPQPELGTLTAAYLSWMENKDFLASNYLAILKPDKLPERLRDQYRITDLLIKAKNIKKGNPFNENDLLPALKWLDEKRFAENSAQPKGPYYYDTDRASKRFSRTTRNFYQQILAPAYLNMGDTAKAALAMVKGDLEYKTLKENSLFQNMSYQSIAFWQKNLSPKSMQGLAVYKTKATGNDVTALLASALNQLKNDDFYELYGTTYLRTHQYDKAVQMFTKVSPNYKYFNPENWYGEESNSKLYANPFIETINDYPKKYVTAKASISKKAFAAEMLRLQKLTISDKKNAALYYYKMANAVYQTGYYGNSWFLISYDWSSYDNSNPTKYVYDGDYKKAQTAKAWYLKARALSTNADFKAKCTFMLAKCMQKQIIMNASPLSFYYYDKKDVKWRNFIKANYNNPYLKELRFNYAKTPFYTVAAGECSYLGDFIKPKTQ